MKSLLEEIQKEVRLSPACISDIEQSFTPKTISKGTRLLEEGQRCSTLYFLASGTARSYYYHEDKEVTSWLYKEHLFFTSWHSFIDQVPSFEYLEILEDAEVHLISFEKLEHLFEKHTEFGSFGRKLFAQQVSFLDYYSKAHLFISAKERYQNLLFYFPDIELRVKLGHIASLLGITQETLSRIRSQ